MLSLVDAWLHRVGMGLVEPWLWGDATNGRILL